MALQVGIEYVPMQWGEYQIELLNELLGSVPYAKYLLGFNEPNSKLQSGLTPEKAAVS